MHAICMPDHNVIKLYQAILHPAGTTPGISIRSRPAEALSGPRSCHFLSAIQPLRSVPKSGGMLRIIRGGPNIKRALENL